ncbi:MAG: hypothetical protein KDK70_25265 [Myxococcales bacterium]|nr:hypothetical protein [Myxococcales bacterium]
MTARAPALRLATAPLALALALASALDLGLGCHEPDDPALTGDSDTEGLAPCDEQPVITYDTFGRGFLATYCDGCHGSAVEDRQGAPDDVVFDTPEGAQDWADRILARSAPADGSPPTMPPAGGVTPDDADRLLVWLICGG